MNRKKLYGYLATTLSVFFAIAVAFFSTNPVSLIRSRASNAHSVIDVTSTSLTMNNNYTVSASSSGFTDGNLFSLSSEGYFRNTDPIRGITNISLTYSSGSSWAKIVPCYYSFEEDQIVDSPEEWPEASESGDFSLNPIDYFKIYNPSSDSITITAISITYSCNTPSYSFSASFTPNWNGKTADNHAEIYIVGTQELIPNGTAQGGWYAIQMTYTNGVYSYTCPNSLTTGIYCYRFVAVTNGSSYSWNPCNEDTITLVLDENVSDITSYTWINEPGYVAADNYTLNLTINVTGQPSSFGNMQFIYNTDNTDNYTWPTWEDYIADGTWSSPFSYTQTGIDASTNLYFKIYLWADNSNIRVGDTGGANFKIIPTGASSINATLSFTYSNSSSIVGTLTINSSGSNTIYHSNVSLEVYETSTISPTFSGNTENWTASYSGENIRIDNNLTITGIKAGTTTAVTLTGLASGCTCVFNVTVPSSTYSASKDTNWCGGNKAVSVTEGWFSSTTVSEISGMGSSFYNGIDTSSFKALIDNGSKFYNTSGVEQHLFYILKDNGVNWIRLKLWVDPYTSGGVSYGGGVGDLTNTLWMAKEAKAAGLSFLLDFHYSDYWTHPGQQIIPKSWNSCNSKSALCAKIKSYTTETLQSFSSAGCLPDMVQLGNEISSGIYLTKYSGGTESFDTYFQPSYLTSGKNTSYGYGTSTWSEYSDYIKAACEGVNAVNSSIKKVLHWAKGSSISAATIKSFFNAMPSSYYDYAAISFYPFYCFDTMSDARTILSGLSSLSKPWFIAETSYPFSGSGYATDNGVSTNFTISNYNKGDTSIYSSYSFDASGQANLIHDLTSAVVTYGGLGIFYWEGAWIPNGAVGWAGTGSSNTWGNQGFFSFDGKAIANINLFAQMSPYI